MTATLESTRLKADTRQQAVATALALLDEDPRTALLLAEISRQHVTSDAQRRHPDRIVNVGIREQLLVSAGGGMALAGMRPVVHTFASFLVERGFEQIKLDLVHQGVGAVLLGTGGSVDAASAGRTHQSPGDVALLDTLPGVTIHAPSTVAEVDAVLREAVAGDGVHYVRVEHHTNRESFAPGPLHVVRRGSGPVVLALGPTLDAALAAGSSYDATVLYTNRVRPLDVAGLRAALDETGTSDVVVVEPWLAGTVGRQVSEGLSDRPHRLLSLGVPREEHRHYGTPKQHVAAYGLDAAGITRSLGHWLT
jgi:transketolase